MKRRVDEATSFILSRVQVKIGRGDKGVRGEIRGVRSFFFVYAPLTFTIPSIERFVPKMR